MSYHYSKTNGGVEVRRLHRHIRETRKEGSGKAFMSHEKPKPSPTVGTEQGVHFLIQELQERLELVLIIGDCDYPHL